MSQSTRSRADWALFALLSVIWAGAYSMTRIAVDPGNPDLGMPVPWVLAGRLTIGAAVLWVLMLAKGERLPPLSDHRRWITIIAMGIVGSVLPFFLITTAQETVDSSLAALYTAASPIFVVLGANALFAEEKMTPRSGVGIMLGFLGVAVLFGPDAIQHFGSASVVAQGLLILATMAYAASSLVARGAPEMRAIPFAAGFVTVGALLSWPLALTVEPASINVEWKHGLAILGLGLLPSGIAQALYMLLIRRAGATFLSLTGYSIPIVSALFGWLFFRETQSWNAVLAFALILGGVWLARNSGRGKL